MEQQQDTAAAAPVDPMAGFIPYTARIRDVAAEKGDGLAILFIREDGSERSVSWRELDTRSTQLARALAKRGLGVGDRLGIKLRNCPEHFFLSYAGWKVGAVVAPVRWDLPDWELERVKAVLQPKLLIEPGDDIIETSAAESTEPLPVVISPNSQALMSSGSTGTPKVILRTMPSVINATGSSNALVELYGPLSKPQRLLVPAPLYHNNGFMSTLNLMNGDELVLLERFNTSYILQAIPKHRITGFVATTVMLQRLVRDELIESTDLSSIEWVMHGAAPLPEWLARKWIDLVGPTHFYVCFGSSEVIGTTFANGVEYLAHPNTVGKPVMNTEMRILDPDGNELPQGDVGMIYMRSPSGIISAYVGDVAPIPKTEDGFGTVGDMGSVDADGFLYLADRRVDMIISGGANIYPAEIEAALSEHPDVADVVVIGLSDPEWGQRVHAIVAPSRAGAITADELIAYAKTRLTSYKAPKTIEFVDAIPRSEATKLNRAALRAERESKQ